MVGVEPTIGPLASSRLFFLVTWIHSYSAVTTLILSNKQQTRPRMIRNKQETARLCLSSSLRISKFGLCRKLHAQATSKAVIFFSSSRRRVFNCPITTIIYVRAPSKSHIILLSLESFLHLTHIALNEYRVDHTITTAVGIHSTKRLDHISTIKRRIAGQLVFRNAQLQITDLFENRGVFRFVFLVFLQLLHITPGKRILTDLST